MEDARQAEGMLVVGEVSGLGPDLAEGAARGVDQMGAEGVAPARQGAIQRTAAVEGVHRTARAGDDVQMAGRGGDRDAVGQLHHQTTGTEGGHRPLPPFGHQPSPAPSGGGDAGGVSGWAKGWATGCGAPKLSE